MENSVKATRANIPLGSLTVNGFMLPDGPYEMSQTQAAKAVGKLEINAWRFLALKAIKSFLGKGYTSNTIELSSEQSKRESRFNVLLLEAVTVDWLTQASQGEKQAISLVWALPTELLEHRSNAVFSATRSKEEYNDRLFEQNQYLEHGLEALGNAFVVEDDLKARVVYYQMWFRRNEIDPHITFELDGSDC